MLLNNFSSQLFLFSKGVSIRRNDRYLKGDLQRGQLSPEYPPGANYPIKAKLKQDQELTFLAMTGDWVKVKTRGSQIEGYVRAKYVLVSKE